MSLNENDNTRIGERIVISSLWLGAWRWSGRFIGLLSMIILARLLLPEDFGIVATALLVVAFFDVLVEFGTDKYLIRMPDPQRSDYDSAWSLRLAVITGISVVIFAAAGPAADYFDEPRLVAVVQVLAGANLLRGFTNIGLMMYRRELQHKKIAIIGLSQRLVGFVTTVVLAVIYQNYWAIVFGEVALRLAELILSFAFHPYRPKLDFSRVAAQWDFSKWIVLRNIAQLLLARGDQFVVARFFGITSVGLYSMATRFAELPTRHLMAPLMPPLYSGLAKKLASPQEFSESVLKVIGATAAIALPAAMLFAVLRAPLVITILGEKWVESIALVAPLVIMLALATLADIASNTIILLGRVRLEAGLNWASAIIVILAMLAAARIGTMETVAWARVAVAAMLLAVYYLLMILLMPINLARLFGMLYRPLIASAATGLVAAWMLTAFEQAWLQLLAGICIGGFVYLVLLYSLWRLAASPDSGEKALFHQGRLLAGKVHRRLRR